MERGSSEDKVPHLLVVIQNEDEKYYEIEHPAGCTKETYKYDGVSYEAYTCRVQWVVEASDLDFIQNPDGRTEGWKTLAPGAYPIVGYTEYHPGEFGGTYGEEWDTDIMFVEQAKIPVSVSITMRPAWRRRQRRHYLQSVLAAPTQEEIADADLILSDPEMETFGPALWLEATMIKEESNA